MAAKSDYVTGTITLTNGSTAFTGTGTGWLLAGFGDGDEIKQVEGQTQWEAMVATITDNTHGTLVRPWGGATGTYAYRMRYQADGQRVTAQARALIELLGDGTLSSLAGLVGPGVIELLPGGGVQVVPRADLINGVAVDRRVNTLSDRAAYDGQAAQFSVYVANVGDGRAATYFKNSATSGDWSAPAYVTGPAGPPSTVPGITWRGTYSGAAAYVVDDGVKFNGSSFRNIVAGTGNAPSSAAPPVDNTWWVVVAAKGTDGTGTGDMVGPAGSIADRISTFADTTGKLAKDSGKTIADLFVSHLSGLTTSPSTAYTNGFIVAPGQAAAISDNTPMKLATGMEKNAGATWAAGNAQGGMEVGTTLTANSSYSTYEIAKPGGANVDILFSASPTAPTMPSGYTHKRRIHTWVTDAAGAIRKVRQVGGWSHFLAPFEITVGTVAFAGPGAAAVNVAMNFPVGVKLEADFAVGVVAPASSPGVFCGVCDPDKGAATIFDTVVYNLGGAASTTIWQQVRCWLNANSQVSVYFNGPGSFRAFVRGYYDARDTYF